MPLSIFDLFSIGIGPSSSHTVGPMRAGRIFAEKCHNDQHFSNITGLKIELFGSLAWTGPGHGTDKAILLGLEGAEPATVDPAHVFSRFTAITQEKTLSLFSKRDLPFSLADDLIYNKQELLPQHSNGMHFSAIDAQGNILLQEVYYSIGGGFVVDADGKPTASNHPTDKEPPFPFTTAAELLKHCAGTNLTIPAIMWENEKTWRSEEEIKQQLRAIWGAMKVSVESGLTNEGILPGGLNVRRRAPNLHRKTAQQEKTGERRPGAMDWLSAYAIAVNEENAVGGRVVTAPTNGAAGIIPSVLYYYMHHAKGASEQDVFTFLLTAGAIGLLYKYGASLSAAEVGCQGEVGVACSMAAGAYAALIGGNTAQIENAAEIGMEHNLGLTCDPIGGLVQIPCIERNAMGAVKAVNAARLSLNEEGTHVVPLDSVIATMLQTGRDMMTKYKETSRGGLAVNIPEC